MRNLYRWALCLMIFMGVVCSGFAGQRTFPVFDGQFYNGLFYPRIDIIEWGAESKTHLEFHIYSKNEPIDLAAEVGMKGGKPVLWLNYHLKSRGENVCRHALAPAQFKEGDKIYAYVDRSDTDYDNIYFSNVPMMDKKLINYNVLPYSTCDDEFASNKPDANSNPKSLANAKPKNTVRGLASDGLERDSPAAQAPVKQSNPTPDKLIDYENSAVPFSF